MKTAEEILEKWYQIYRDTPLFSRFDTDIKAMEEYADQFKKQLKEKEEQLTKSNEMAEKLAGQIGLFLNFGGKEHLEEALEQYQNSKK